MSIEPSQSLRVLRLRDVIQRVGLSRSTIYDRINPKSSRYDESFPKPIKIGASAIGWIESSISEWIESKIKQSHSFA
ncbi:AlpA family transcriptional regulator [Pseudomonas gingeri]|uniref:AlpA family transcriptional regulator n=1 Tax=Pseudomonas gingeri TaxID=117681 RepID=A0A7Y8C2N1_9PSED|nr:AlpA family transcriptional regulator [Pseudomonas gingeri]NWB51088.1 AlpA family transcriptional regulator [Pseudomonas gingeri]NWB97665.1 AlpA family transcriptional regulator [Pseudomonas gingeri]